MAYHTGVAVDSGVRYFWMRLRCDTPEGGLSITEQIQIQIHTLFHKMQLSLNSAAHLTLGMKKYDHITPAFRKLHWLPVEQQIMFKILCLTFKVLNSLATGYIASLIIPYSPTRALCSSDHQLLCIPKVNMKNFRERSFSHAAPSLYNRLPLDLKQSPSLATFQSNLKMYLFKMAYEPSWVEFLSSINHICTFLHHNATSMT